MELTADIETNGLAWWMGGGREDLKVHCIVTQDVSSDELLSFGPDPSCCDGTIEDGLDHLSQSTLLIGHNIAGFDIPVLELLYPDWRWPWRIYDTRFVSRQMYPLKLMMERTAKFRNANGRSEKQKGQVYPRRLMNPMALYKLEAWGYRLKFHKGTHLADSGAQEEFTPDLLYYCQRDVRLNTILYRYLTTTPAKPGWPVPSFESMLCESFYGYLLTLQEQNGVGFNRKQAEALEAELRQRSHDLLDELRSEVKPWFSPDGARNGIVYPKRTMRAGVRKDGVRYGGWGKAPVDEKGRYLSPDAPGCCARTKIKLVEFNPGSRRHIERLLRKKYGWEPAEYNEDGTAHLDDDVLAALDYPPVPKIMEYLTVDKRLGQLSDGKQAWLRQEREGVIRGRVAASGTRTSRCSHSKPNVAQVPKVGKPYGEQCRALFRPTRPGWLQVGCDASGIEMRLLAHYMGFYDEGEFAKILMEGDVHEDWRAKTGIFIRDNQKTWTYATLYGAGDIKRGLIILADWRMAHERGLADQKPPPLRYAGVLGERSRKGLLQGLPALDLLLQGTRATYKAGFLRAIDGRVIQVISEHGALNDLLQSAGAVVMKHAKILFYEDATAAGYVHGRDYGFMLDVHDEWQIECPPEFSEDLGTRMAGAIKAAGVKLSLRIELDGEYKIGSNWAETH